MRIILRIRKGGKTETIVERVQGASCYDATANLERRLGKVTVDTKTDEYYADVLTVEQERELA